MERQGNRKTNMERPARRSLQKLGAMLQEHMQNIVEWQNEKPRSATVIKVISTVIQGMLLGFGIGFVASFITSGFSKVTIYAINTFSVMFLKLGFQWLWILVVVPQTYRLVRWFVRKTTGLDVPEGVANQQSGQQYLAMLTVPAIVALAIATILATEELSPSWLNDTWVIVGMSTLGGGVAALMEALSDPDNIYALRWNRHRYQNTPSYQEGTNRNRATRRSGRK